MTDANSTSTTAMVPYQRNISLLKSVHKEKCKLYSEIKESSVPSCPLQSCKRRASEARPPESQKVAAATNHLALRHRPTQQQCPKHLC